MSFLSLLNNVHFAVEMIGAISFGMVGWLAVDAFSVTRDFKTVSRAMGFFLLATASIVHAASFRGDLYGYLEYILLIVGLLFVIANLIAEAPVDRPEFKAILLLPPLASMLFILHGAVFLCYGIVAALAYRQMRKEFKYALLPFIVSFVFLTVGSLFPILMPSDNLLSVSWVGEHLLRLLGFFALGVWVWSYLQLRIREELLLVLIGTTLFMATVVSLSFSTLLVKQLTQNTSDNLLVNARVLSVSIDHLMGEVSATASFVSRAPGAGAMILKNDFTALRDIAEKSGNGLPGGVITIVGAKGDVLASTGMVTRSNDVLSDDKTTSAALLGGSPMTIEWGGIEGLAIRSGAPVFEKGKIVGAVIFGYPLDNAYVDGVKEKTGLDMSIYVGNKIVATTEFMKDGRTRLIGTMETNPLVKDSIFMKREPIVLSTTLGSRAAITAFAPLSGEKGDVVGMLSASRLESTITETMNVTNRYTIVTVLLIILLLAFPLYIIAKRLENEVG